MAGVVLPSAVLDALREVGDPALEAEPLAQDLEPEVLATGARALKLPAPGPEPVPFEIDPHQLVLANDLFQRYGTEIAGALLLAVLPHSYAAEHGAAVLGATQQFERDPARRVRRTAGFLLEIMGGGLTAEAQRLRWDPSASKRDDPKDPLQPWEVCRRLRQYHQILRDDFAHRRKQDTQLNCRLGAGNKPPLNQQDLLTLLLSLSITVFEVLEQFGINWTADEQAAYLHLWDVIGQHLGIGTPRAIDELDLVVARGPDAAVRPLRRCIPKGWIGLRPPTVSETRALLAQLRIDQWPDTGPTGPLERDRWSGNRAGRVLAKALLDELAAAMPRPRALMPIAVIRALAPEPVRKRLSLGANGLVLGALVSLPKRSVVVDRFTRFDAPNPITGRTLRMMANDITARAAVRFLHAPDVGEASFAGGGR